jgi:hypothetical protein
LARGLATPGLEAEKAIFRLKKSSKNKIQKKNFEEEEKKKVCAVIISLINKIINLTSSTLRREHKNRFSFFFLLFSVFICSVDF